MDDGMMDGQMKEAEEDGRTRRMDGRRMYVTVCEPCLVE
jgi:hypothetical protein